MIITKPNPTGIEYKIYEFQTILEGVLNNPIDKRFNWIGTVAIYGKVYKTTKNGLTIPEAYTSNGEYIQPFVDDKKAAVIGFVINDETVANHVPIADVDIILTLDLFKIYGTKTRDVSHCITDIYNIMHNKVKEMGEIRQGIDNVFRNFTGVKNYFPTDMSNWFVFSINFKTFFDYKN
jgi:hypothetical protein